jgi:hypothetical protein
MLSFGSLWIETLTNIQCDIITYISKEQYCAFCWLSVVKSRVYVHSYPPAPPEHTLYLLPGMTIIYYRNMTVRHAKTCLVSSPAPLSFSAISH